MLFLFPIILFYLIVVYGSDNKTTIAMFSSVYQQRERTAVRVGRIMLPAPVPYIRLFLFFVVVRTLILSSSSPKTAVADAVIVIFSVVDFGL